MNFVFVFLVLIGVAVPAEMKTAKELEEAVEALQQELNFWKQKTESNEAKMKNIEAKFESNKVKIGQVGEDITKINSEIGHVEEDVEAIKSEIAMRSTFCGYRYHFDIHDPNFGTLTYDRLVFESNNIPGASFDLGSGRYTAGAEGMYRVDLAIGAMQSASVSYTYNRIYIQRNGQDIPESRIESHIDTGSISLESGGRSVIIHLEKDDVVSVRVALIYEFYYTTFCVSYEGA